MKKIPLLLPFAVILGLSVLSGCTSNNTSTPTSPTTTTSSVDANNISTDTSSDKEENIVKNTVNTQDASTNNQVQGNTSTDTIEIAETFTKSLSYRVPHGSVSTTYSITTDSVGIITAASASMTSGDHESNMYHNRFNSQLSSKVIGKKLSELSGFATIGGASLTTDGFNQFLQSL